jgi:hypothetical protein
LQNIVIQFWRKEVVDLERMSTRTITIPKQRLDKTGEIGKKSKLRNSESGSIVRYLNEEWVK